MITENLKKELYTWATNIQGPISFDDIELTQIAMLYLATKYQEKNTNWNETFTDNDVINLELKTIFETQKNLIQHLASTYSKKTIQNFVKEEEIGIRKNRFAEMSSTPQVIIDLAEKILKIQQNDTILDICSGRGAFLLETAQQTNNQVNGVELNFNSYVYSKLRFAILGIKNNIKQGNAAYYNMREFQSNKVFLNAPFWSRLERGVQSFQELPYVKSSPYREYIKNNTDIIWIMIINFLLSHPNFDKMVVVTYDAPLVNKIDQELRQELITSGFVEAVIHLPNRIINYTSIPITLLVLSPNRQNAKREGIKMIHANDMDLATLDVTEIYQAYAAETSTLTKIVPISQILENEAILTANRYVGHQFKEGEYVELGSIAKNINRGAMVKKAEFEALETTEETEYQYLMLQNFNDGVQIGEFPYLKITTNDYDKFCVSENSLIISKLAPFKIGTVKTDGKKIIANGNLYFLDIDESKIYPKYVEAYLQSEDGLVALESLTKGTVMKTLSITDLKKIQIPLLTTKKQEVIAEKYKKLSDQVTFFTRSLQQAKEDKKRLFKEEFICE